MASKILATKNVSVPTLVPMDGYNSALLVRSDPQTHWVDVTHAFEMVLGEKTAHRALAKLLTGLDGKVQSEGGFNNKVASDATSPESSIDLSKFSRVRWKDRPGGKARAGIESIIAPLPTVVQMLMMINSCKTRYVRCQSVTARFELMESLSRKPVSYTHLTLPTKRIV